MGLTQLVLQIPFGMLSESYLGTQGPVITLWRGWLLLFAAGG